MGKALLVLADGATFEGNAWGASGETTGEVVFNTGMVGYQEILTDPSYTGQMVTLTYPLIGNYGINFADDESQKIYARALIIRELQQSCGNWRSQEELNDYLKNQNIIGIEGIDTRRLVLHLRRYGSMKAILSTEDSDKNSLMKKLESVPDMEGQDLAKEVTTSASYGYEEIIDKEFIGFPEIAEKDKVDCIAAYDFGIKRNILRYLRTIAKKVIVFPANASIEEVLQVNPKGVFLSNGPGDPAAVTYAIENLKELFEKKPQLPVFGICLGHQLTALALDASTYKMKFGHHGINQPVKNMVTGKVEITSQNHGFAVKQDTLPEEIEVTHVNLNDGSLEGLQHKSRPLFTVQYHPEAAPGPNDANYLFMKFYELMVGV